MSGSKDQTQASTRTLAVAKPLVISSHSISGGDFTAYSAVY